MFKSVLAGLVAASLVAPAFAVAQTQDPAQDAFDRAKAAFSKRGEGQNAAAIAAVNEGLAVVQDATLKYDLLILASRAYYYSGEKDFPNASDPAQVAGRLAAYETGMAKAREAQAANPALAEGYYFFAVNLGQWGMTKGVTEAVGRRLELVTAIRGTMARESRESAAAPIAEKGGIRLDGHGAYRILGRMYHVLPQAHGGDKVQSEAFLRRAVNASPGIALNVRYLALVLLDSDDAAKRAEARSMLEVYAAKNATDADMDQNKIPENTDDIARIKKLLESLGG